MPDEVLDVNAVSSPAIDVPAPSAEVVVPAPVSEEAKIPLSRLNEVLEQKKAAEAREAQLLEALRVQRTVAAPTTTQPSFWEGRVNHADPATAQYWQQQKEMFELAKAEAKKEALQELQPAINAGVQKIAGWELREFRAQNPDIAQGSAEEQQVISYMAGQVDGIRHSLDSARNNVVIKRLEAENRALKAKQSGTPLKAAANVETSSGIPATAGLPLTATSWRERVGEAYEKTKGDVLATVNAALGKS